MTTIRRPPGVSPAVVVRTAERTTTAPAKPTAGPQKVSGFDPIATVKELVSLFKQVINPVKASDVAQKTDWFTAPLIVNGIDGKADVRQRGLADCYMVATVASIAQQHPDFLRDAMRENAEGTVSFRFFKENGRAEWVTVSRELPMRDGSPSFGHSTQREAWFPLLEKAYAQFKGGYEAIGNGGYTADAQYALLGTRSRHTKLEGASADQVFADLKAGLARGDVIGASTPARSDNPSVIRTLWDAFKATVAGIVPQHVYSVWGTQEVDGKKYVLLRNPWAQTEPGSLGPIGSFSKDGANDGVFAYPLEDFMKRFDWVTAAPLPAN